MKRFFTSPVFWGGVLIYAAYIVAVKIFPPQQFIEGWRIVQVAVSIAAVIAYCAKAVEAVKAHRPDVSQQLGLGIFVGFTASFFDGMWQLLWRLADQPHWMQDYWFRATTVFTLCIAAVLHLTAPGSVDGRVPTRNLIWLGCAVGLAALLSGFVLTNEPEVRVYVTRFVEHIRPK